MVSHINGIFGDIAIPVTFNFIITVTVLTLYLLIQTNPPLPVMLQYSMFALISFTFLCTVFNQYSELTQQSRTAVQWKKENMNSRNKYVEYRLKTCFLLKTRIGPFHTIDPSTLVIAVTAIVNHTTSMLIATN